MSSFKAASPQFSIKLIKTISRSTVDGKSSVSSRYKGKDAEIDLTPFFDDQSSIKITKSVREPAGAFVLSFADKPYKGESLYGLIETMDMIEIRFWGGIGEPPAVDNNPPIPVRMRGFVGAIHRNRSVDQAGRPARTVTVNGMDYGKIWQMYQVVYLQAYSDGTPLLTSFALNELFGAGVVNAMKASTLIKTMVDKVLNPYISRFMPANSKMPRKLTAGDDITVAHGMANLSYQEVQGSIYDFMKFHGDVGVWNELYIEDREVGAHVVYRPNPALAIDQYKSVSKRKIFSDSPGPVFVTIPDYYIKSMTASRSDATVSNFFWVTSSRFDLIDDMQRKLQSIPSNDGSVFLQNYQNCSPDLYGTRPLYEQTQQGGDGILNFLPGVDDAEFERRSAKMLSWLDGRRQQLLNLNKDNSLFESGSMTVKGGITRDDGSLFRAGDFITVLDGNTRWEAYAVQVDDDFMPFRSFTSTISFERGTGFANRVTLDSGKQSPWLIEQGTRG